MTDKLPGNLLALFQPRPPLRYLPPCDFAPEQRRTARVGGVSSFLEALKNPEPFEPTESVMQKRERLREEKRIKKEEGIKEATVKCMLSP